MAWAAFQKSNWTRSSLPFGTEQYFPAASNATATGGLVFTAGQVNTLTLTASFKFQGNRPVFVSAPEGAGSGYATAAAAGVTIENAWLEGPASGSYAKGNHPLLLVNLSSGAAYTTAATGFDLIGWQ